MATPKPTPTPMPILVPLEMPLSVLLVCAGLAVPVAREEFEVVLCTAASEVVVGADVLVGLVEEEVAFVLMLK